MGKILIVRLLSILTFLFLLVSHTENNIIIFFSILIFVYTYERIEFKFINKKNGGF